MKPAEGHGARCVKVQPGAIQGCAPSSCRDVAHFPRWRSLAGEFGELGHSSLRSVLGCWVDTSSP